MHVAITGASSGSGRALAGAYGRAGAKLTLVARRRELLEELSREIGREVHIRISRIPSGPRSGSSPLRTSTDPSTC